MERKSRVFVFDRVELSLLVFFFVIMSITAFVLGMRLGKKRALDHVGITEQHVQEFELKSDKEEYVETVVNEAPAIDEPQAGEASTKNLDEETFQKLQDEFEKLDRKNFKAPKADEASIPTTEPTPTNNNSGSTMSVSGDIIGKYTVQLGSYRTIEEAQQFAGGFVARGYKPLINEVEIGNNKSKWYRVSLGAFDSVDSAKSYIKTESTLFNSQEYVITTIK